MTFSREVRQVRLKGKKRLLGEADGGDRGRDRFDALWRDYHDLLKETEAKKRRLESINQQKLGLIAEVKFLRKKYHSFAKDDSQKTHYRLKKQAQEIPHPVDSYDASTFAQIGASSEVPSTSRSTNLDLNQGSVMNDEGVDCQGNPGHLELGKLDEAGVDETDVNLSVFRDTRNSPASDHNRMVAWQDRVALKV